MFGKRKTSEYTVNVTAATGFEKLADEISPTKGYEEFLRDLAVVYPEINRLDHGGWGYMSLLSQFRVRDVKMAADAIRAAENAKVADALVREFRGAKPSSKAASS